MLTVRKGIKMDRSRQQWVHRNTSEGDIYCDTDARKVYRNEAHLVLATSQDLYSLPTFPKIADEDISGIFRAITTVIENSRDINTINPRKIIKDRNNGF